ncbi:hypothetical protein GCM10010329_15540 [Streptomyces spiroverticillatus]|uniref:DUF11 domain-containing protein n=2 Tax=Streptomyces finlayi TaxID=67296 RepID=A0A918X3N5_9ACTN|nr:hypothetical protein GCM10010329_15540 [Streptomyces spiroverticillatus]GHD07230.1 hypothetical protein GCM10010334_59570 [Streptomyces finlayi]
MRRPVVAAVLLGALLGPAGAGVAAERGQPPAEPNAVRAGRGVLATLSPSGQRVAPGQSVNGVLTVTNDSDTAMETVKILLNGPKATSSYPSWYTTYTCPAGWLDLDGGDASNPEAGCYYADDPDDRDGKPWNPGDRAVIQIQYKVPQDAQTGEADIFTGETNFWDPRNNGGGGGQVAYVDKASFTVVPPDEIPLVDPWILVAAAGAGAVVYARRRQSGRGVRIAV